MTRRSVVKESGLAKVMTTARVARLMTKLMGEEWSTERARRWLRRNGCLIRIDDPRTGRSRFGTTTTLIRRQLADLAYEIEVVEAWDDD